MNEKQVVALLARECKKAGGLAAWARKAGVAHTYPSLVLNGHVHPGFKVLSALGLEKVMTYRKVKP